jgi:hemerythrin superfamily protein
MESTNISEPTATRAPRETFVGVFATLAQQHAEASAMLEEVTDDVENRMARWPAIREALVAHERGEVRELYPELRARDETRDLADHHDDEARDLDDLIDRIERTAINSEAWGALFTTLVDMVTRHVAEEEESIFPHAQRVLGVDKTQEIDARFSETYGKLVVQV